jgi:hypothetical protein
MASDKDVSTVLYMLAFNTAHRGINLFEWTRKLSIHHLAKFGYLGKVVEMGHHYSEVMPTEPDVTGLDGDDAELEISEWKDERKKIAKKKGAILDHRASSFADMESYVAKQVKDLAFRSAEWEDRVETDGAITVGVNVVVPGLEPDVEWI